ALVYWLNPITIYVCYWHGQLDVLPVLLVCVSLWLLKTERFWLSGVVLGAAISAKFAMGLVLPFYLVLALRERRYAASFAPLVLGTLIGVLPSVFGLLSPGFRRMVLGTPGAANLFAFALGPTAETQIFVLPLALSGLFLAAWWIGRSNWQLLLAEVALAFFLSYLFTPASPGWSLWLAPFISLLSLR